LKRVAVATAVATLLLVGVGVLVSSAYPDGLERVAANLGFASHGARFGPGSPLANYEVPFFHSRWAAQASAGLVGVVLLYGFGVLFGRMLKRRKQDASRHPG
jgi:hypothetical protein